MDERKLTALRRYFAEEPELGVASVYLFGSQAGGRAHAESHVDVAILLDRGKYPASRDRFDARVRLESELLSALGMNAVDVVILNDIPLSSAAGSSTKERSSSWAIRQRITLSPGTSSSRRPTSLPSWSGCAGSSSRLLRGEPGR